MNITYLVVKQFKTDEEETHTYPEGYVYSYFFDPETEKYYEPLDTFVVSGENLEEYFREVEV